MSVSSAVNQVFRRGILKATTNGMVQRFVTRYGMQLGAARYVAGENLDEAVESLRRLERQGFKTNTTIFGEHLEDEASANAIADEYQRVIARLHEEGLRTNIALKPTHVGLNVSQELAFRNISRLADRAAEVNNTIRMDMEDSPWVDGTLGLYRQLRESGRDNVGTVLQAYLYRTEADLESLLPYAPNLRIVKGAYLEPPEIAYPSKADVDRAYVRITERALLGDGYTAIATHDRRIIEHFVDFTYRHKIPRERFEFQMLYGIATDLQLQMLRRGYTVLISTNYGMDWYPYLMRRMAERPANLLFVARHAIRRPARNGASPG